MSSKNYSVGEMAAMAHVTVRTLQHYDHIGLLSASRSTESGRRFYSEGDLIRLEQIQFYKSMGFSLDEIKTNLTDSHSREEIRAMLVKQAHLLLRKIEQLHTSFTVIGASIKVMDANHLPPYALILRFLRMLPGDDIFEWAPSLLDSEQQSVLSETFKNLEEALSFHHLLKGLLVDALVLSQSNVPPSHPQAQELARKWQEMLSAVSAGNPAVLDQLAEIGEMSKFGALPSQQLPKEAFDYIEQAVEIGQSKPTA